MKEIKRRTDFGVSSNQKLLTNLRPRLFEKEEERITLLFCSFTLDERYGNDFMLGFKITKDATRYEAECRVSDDPIPWKADYDAVVARVVPWLSKYGLVLNTEDSTPKPDGDQYIYAGIPPTVEVSFEHLSGALRELFDLLGIPVGQHVTLDYSNQDFVLVGPGDGLDDWQELTSYLQETYFGHPKKPASSCRIR